MGTWKVENVTTRPPMFRVELTPQEDVPLSCPVTDWEALDEHQQIVLRDVHPGKYRLVVDDWLREPMSVRLCCLKASSTSSQGSAPLTVSLSWQHHRGRAMEKRESLRH